MYAKYILCLLLIISKYYDHDRRFIKVKQIVLDADRGRSGVENPWDAPDFLGVQILSSRK